MPPPSYRGCWHGVSRDFLIGYRQYSGCLPYYLRPQLTEVYNPKIFILHTVSLRQAFAHCAIFPTAASRRSLGRISVPVWPITLSGRLPIIALVSHYLTNKLIGRRFILKWKPCGYLCYINHAVHIKYLVLAPLSRSCPNLQGRLPTHYAPVRHLL